MTAVVITNNESNASRRVVPVWCVGSNGTTPASGEAGGQPQWMMGGVFKGSTSATLSAWSAAAGQYFVVLSASEVSLVGQGAVRYASGSALESSTPFQVVAYDSGDSIRAGLTALPSSGVASVFSSGDLVGLKAQVHSGATVGAGNFAPGTYSGTTFSAGNLAPGTYSGVTVGVNNLAAGSYSGVTIAGVTRVNSLVTIADGTYSAVTIGGVTRVNSGVSLASADYSGVTVQAGNFVSTVTAGVVLDKTGYGLTASERSAGADALIGRNIAGGSDGGRTVGSALYVLRNRVDATGSTGTVYGPDDQASAWTFSVTTGGFPLNSVDPS